MYRGVTRGRERGGAGGGKLERETGRERKA